MQVFINHSHSDSSLADKVSEALQKTGLKVWDAQLNLLPGDNWAALIGRALEESDAMVVLLTPNSISFPHGQAEIAFALGSKSYSNRLTPVAVGGRKQFQQGEIRWVVRQLRWVDLPNAEGGSPSMEAIADALCNWA